MLKFLPGGIEMERITGDLYSVRATDCDYNGRLRMDALFIMMQEGAEHNAATLGAGHGQLLSRGLFFALTRMHVRITRMPRLWISSTSFAKNSFAAFRFSGSVTRVT